MDPQEVWRTLVAIAARWQDDAHADGITAADEMSELVLDLNTWLLSGGFPPRGVDT